MSARFLRPSERTEPVHDHNGALASGQTVFPAISVSTQPPGREESASTSRFRRITRIPSWVRARSSETTSTSPTPSAPAPRRHIRSTPRLTPPSPATRIPPAPSSPPPSLPMHPRASRLSFGVGTIFAESDRHSTSPAGIDPPSSPSDPRRRSISSPGADTRRFRHSNAITPRPPIVSSSWDDNRLPSKHYSLPLSTLAAYSHASTPTVASSQNNPSNLGDSSTRPGPRPALPGNEGTNTIPKLDFVAHFEAITQLNLKMESEEELTAEELGRALKYLFSRYHGVLDSVGEFKAQLDGENAELRNQIDALQRQLQNNDAEISRLKSLLAEHGISCRFSSESTETVRGPSISSSRSATSPRSSHPPSSRVPGSPGPPPTSSLPPLPPVSDKRDSSFTTIDARRYISRVPLPPTTPPALHKSLPLSDGQPRAI